MGKVTTNISFDKEFLNKLRNDLNACVNICKEVYHLALHPFHLTDLKTSIKSLLNAKIAKYDNKLGGILLGYQNIQLLDSAGAINFDSCFIHFNIQAEFYIFKPDIGQIMTGVVSKKSKDHVGCLVHKTFNVSLPKSEDCENWLGHTAQLGQDVQFEITFTNLDGKLPYIRGKILSIASDDSGFSTSEEPLVKNSDIETCKKSKKRKRKHDISLDDMDSDANYMPKEKKPRKSDRNVSGEIDSDTAINEKHKKKQKKNKTKESSAELTIVEGELTIGNSNVEINNSKKNKKHKVADISEAAESINNAIFNNSESVSENHKTHKKHKHKIKGKLSV